MLFRPLALRPARHFGARHLFLRPHSTLFNRTPRSSTALHALQPHSTLFNRTPRSSTALHALQPHSTLFNRTPRSSTALHALRPLIAGTIMMSNDIYAKICCMVPLPRIAYSEIFKFILFKNKYIRDVNEYFNIMPFVEIDGDENDISAETETLDVFNVNDVPPADDDQCIICLAKLNTKPTYSLPECNHTFHQNCIMHWFRQGSSKCPLCNNNGSIQNNSADGVCWHGMREKYAVLRRYSRRKNAPLKLKQFVAKLRRHEKLLKVVRKNVSEFKKREGIFGELNKEYAKLLTKRRRCQYKIRRMKNLLGRSHQIIPVILVERRYVH